MGANGMLNWRTTHGEDQIGTAANNRASDLFGTVVPTKGRIPLYDEVFAFDIAEPVHFHRPLWGITTLRDATTPVNFA